MNNMKVSKIKSNGRIFETQFNDEGDTLLKNATQYFKEDNIEIVDMTDTEYRDVMKIQNDGDVSDDERKEIKIKNKMNSILRKQAKKELGYE